MAKLLLVGTFIVVGSYGLRGHDILTGLVLSVLFLTLVAKVIFAIVARRRGGLPPGRGGSGHSGKPVPGGRPPSLSAAAQIRHEPTV